MNMDKKVTLGYWGIRGRGQIPRLLLAYTGAVWEDVKYTQPAQWFSFDKDELGLPFPNLPYLIEGDYKLTQSEAIQRYIIQRSDKRQELLGKDFKQAGIINNLLGVLKDSIQALAPLMIDKNYKQKLPATWQKIKPKFQLLQKFIKDRQFAMNHLSLVDFVISESSYGFEKFFPQNYKNYPFLQRIRQNFNNLPEIKNYYSQQSSVKGPFLPPHLASIKF